MLPLAAHGQRVRFTPPGVSATHPVTEGMVYLVLTTSPVPGHRYHLFLDRICPDGAPAEAHIYDNVPGTFENLATGVCRTLTARAAL